MCLQNLPSMDHAFPDTHEFQGNLLQVFVNLQEITRGNQASDALASFAHSNQRHMLAITKYFFKRAPLYLQQKTGEKLLFFPTYVQYFFKKPLQLLQVVWEV